VRELPARSGGRAPAAAAERAEEARLQAEQAKREAELQDEEARREQERRDEAARLAAEAEQRRRDEQERRLQQAARAAEAAGGAAHAAGAEDSFDPHAVLGVAPGAGAEEIRTAYEQAKAKYDPREYEHLGVELQAHFKAKADAVERAFQMLDASE
jgi:DnaJ-domain-containing protein 1